MKFRPQRRYFKKPFRNRHTIEDLKRSFRPPHGALGRKPCIHARLHRLGRSAYTKSCEKCGLETRPQAHGGDLGFEKILVQRGEALPVDFALYREIV